MKKSPLEFYTEQGAEWLSQRKTDEHTAKELEYITRFLKKGWKILDLACGYGRMAFPLASMGFEVEPIFALFYYYNSSLRLSSSSLWSFVYSTCECDPVE